MVLALFVLQIIFHRRSNLWIPPAFQAIILFFIFLSLYLSEFCCNSERYFNWDVMLHFGSALLMGYTGFLLIYALNRDKNFNFRLSPFFIGLYSFSFTVMICALWEILEFLIDKYLGTDMQKSRNLILVTGQIDTRLGVVDTMQDLISNVIGAFIIAVFGFRIIRRKEQFNINYRKKKARQLKEK